MNRDDEYHKAQEDMLRDDYARSECPGGAHDAKSAERIALIRRAFELDRDLAKATTKIKIMDEELRRAAWIIDSMRRFIGPRMGQHEHSYYGCTLCAAMEWSGDFIEKWGRDAK